MEKIHNQILTLQWNFDFIANVKNLGDFNARRSRWPAENLPLIFLKVSFVRVDGSLRKKTMIINLFSAVVW